MKKNLTIKQAAQQAVKSRVFVMLWILLFIEVVLAIVLTIVFAKTGQPGVPYRYDGYSVERIFRDNGSYLINLPLFAFVTSAINCLLSLKVYAIKGRNMGLAVLWASVIVMFIAIIFSAALFGLGNML